MTTLFRKGMMTTAFAMCASLSIAATIQFDYTGDTAGEGFNDATFGVQRKAAFENAVNIWAVQLISPQAIRVKAKFDPLGGTALSATLGFAAPQDFHAMEPGIPANTWYCSALADSIANTDFGLATPDINCTFNTDVDNGTVLGAVNWYYGLDGNPGFHVDFRSTVLHEIGHGLGFLSVVPSSGVAPVGLLDIYTKQLARSPSTNPADPSRVDVSSMSDAQRFSAWTSGQLYWKGSIVLSAKSNTLVKMYAPNPYENGSSVSHWDTSNNPNLLMEPFDTGPKSNIDLTKEAFRDIGWTFVPNAGVTEWLLFQ